MLPNGSLTVLMMSHLLLVFFLTVVAGFLLIFLIQKTSNKNLEGDAPPLDSSLENLDSEAYYSLCCTLLEKLGLVIKDSYRDTESEMDVYAENPAPFIGGPVIVHLSLYPEGGKVTSVDVMNFASNLVGERRGKGLYITTGEFAPEVHTLPELPPMELIDGKKLAQLMKEYGIAPLANT